MGPLYERLGDAVTFHGCPGQMLGVRIALAGCGALGINEPRAMGGGLVVSVEADRCAGDVIQALTGCSLGKRTLTDPDYGKMAATFAITGARKAVRVVVRDGARERATAYAPGVADPRKARLLAYQVMPEAELLELEPVRIGPGG